MFKIIAIDMINSPNTFKESEWSIVPNTPARLYFQLQIEDSLGSRRYLPAAGSTIQIEFPRARSLSPSNPVSQTVSKNGIQIAEDKSMYYLDLTTTDTQNIISGTVKITFTENSKQNIFLQNYFIVRKPTTPGN